MNREYWIGEKAYNAFNKGREAPKFDELAKEDQYRWIRAGLEAATNSPAPVHFKVAYFTRYPGAPIEKHFYADNTEKSIADACEELRMWLCELLFRLT